MTEEQQGEPVQIEATGNLNGNMATIEAKAGTASMVLTMDLAAEAAAGPVTPADLLLRAFPQVVDQVLDNLIAQAEADTRGAE